MEKQDLILETCLLAGRIMMENGSEVYRVEDTMNRIAANAGEPNSISYVTATGLFMGLRKSHYAQVEDVHDRTINLEKIVAVNQLSRKFAAQEISLEELHQALSLVNTTTPFFPFYLQILSAGLVSCLLMYIFGGDWADFFATFFVGMIGFVTSYYVKKWSQLRFFDMYAAAFLIGLLAIVCVRIGVAQNVDNIIIGAVMPLVPGVAITNSFRDILAGDLISGTARGIEALFTAAAIAVGIATIFSIFGGGI
ncbi:MULTISPECIES: threonine/serine exporter family protein [Enterococcus]|uniref:threonine/serine exporter family protein n=1 Tax=Enterococcus TaxID=1350 RepID=UPI00065E8D83|nr:MULTISPECIES: threonine/serine exporter family protein [Enterococcus]KAF1300017.1 hypothetical protein BAU16_13410 [Enterococcus sp. JM9B]